MAAEDGMHASAGEEPLLERDRGARRRRAAGRRRGVFNWFTRSAELREARAAVRELDARARELRRRARLACQLAERAFDPIDPFPAGSGAPLAAELYRQATHWALCALQPGASAPPVAGSGAAAELWGASQAHLLWAVPDADTRAQLRWLFVDAAFVEIAERPPTEQQALAASARALAHASLEAAERPERMLGRALFQRFVRTVLLSAVLAATLLVTLVGRDWFTRKPDLAAGKPWKASSTWAPCEPLARRCGGLTTDIFFHTGEDASPWIEYDLLKPARFASVFVRNRSEAAPDRAIPLVVEVSQDKKTWRSVARRKTGFREWTARFKPQTARYVRLRVDRRSYLHLEKVMIHPP
jgi:hypothetical protein